MQRAIDLAVANVRQGGGPFGAVIARGGEIVAEGVNRVTADHDPTAHAEVRAIRAAAEKLESHDLTGCDIYSSCEPCPMCLGAIYWAHLGHLYFAATKADAARSGFDDAFIYSEIPLAPAARRLPATPVAHPDALRPFEAWDGQTDRKEY